MPLPTLFSKPRLIELSDLRMAIYESGRGVPVILCHGFPELAFSWRHQIAALSAAGFHAIAPDMRGYGQTGAPKSATGHAGDVALYDMDHLANDLIGLLDALEIEQAIFCGHDWGGFVVWEMALRHPDRVMGVIGVNTPFMPHADREPIASLRHIYGEDNYIVMFQDYGVADKILNADIERSIRFWFRKGMRRAEYDAQPQERRNFSFIKAYQAGGELGGEALLNQDELAFYTQAYKKTGYTGGINWYRNITRNWETTQDRKNHKEHISHPCLMISAADDIVLRPEMTDGMEDYIPDLEKHIIADCGHWTQQERPEELNQLMIDWLKKRFG